MMKGTGKWEFSKVDVAWNGTDSLSLESKKGEGGRGGLCTVFASVIRRRSIATNYFLFGCEPNNNDTTLLVIVLVFVDVESLL